MTMPLKTLPWDVVDHLVSDDAIAAYLDACLDDGDPKLIAAALGDIARAKGVTDLAARTGLSAATLERCLSGDEVPAFSTILKVVEALGLRLAARQKSAHAA
jgi:probable addiction module antidote protein